MNYFERFLKFGCTVALAMSLAISSIAAADWQADPNDKRQVKAQSAIVRIKEKLPASQNYFDQAYGYAILHSVITFQISLQF